MSDALPMNIKENIQNKFQIYRLKAATIPAAFVWYALQFKNLTNS